MFSSFVGVEPITAETTTACPVSPPGAPITEALRRTAPPPGPSSLLPPRLLGTHERQNPWVDASSAAALRDVPGRAVVLLGDLDDAPVGNALREGLGDLERLAIWEQFAKAFVNRCGLIQFAQSSENLRRLWTRSSAATRGGPDEVTEDGVGDSRMFRHGAGGSIPGS